MHVSALSLAICLALAGVVAAASSAAPAEFDRIVVTATRTGRPIADVPNTVDVIDRAAWIR